MSDTGTQSGLPPKSEDMRPNRLAPYVAGVVWKFDAHDWSNPWAEVEMPSSAMVVSAAEQSGRVRLWAVCDLNRKHEPPVARWFFIAGTGHELPTASNGCQWVYLHTFFTGDDAAFVWHLFEQVQA